MYEVNVYYLPEDGNKQLSANFKVKEFACKDGSNIVLINPKLVGKLQTVRTKVAKAVTINSAYRTVSHNTKEGGSPKSMHLFGNASDIKVVGLTPTALAKVCDSIIGNDGAVLLYPSFVHIDVRGYKYRAKTTDGKNFTKVDHF